MAEIPETMTADKLRNIADWLDTFDAMGQIVIEWGARTGTSPGPAMTRAFNALAGKSIQNDLRSWADEIEPEWPGGGDEQGYPLLTHPDQLLTEDKLTDRVLRKHEETKDVGTFTRRQWLTMQAILHGTPLWVAIETVATIAIEHPEIDYDEAKTWAEWEDG